MNIKILMAPEVPLTLLKPECKGRRRMGLHKEDEYEDKGSFFVS